MSDVTIKIVADDSEVAAATQRAAGSIEDMGKSAAASSEKFERMGGSLVHLTGHIAGEAVPGMGRLERSIVTMGESAIGVGPMLAVMVPVAALVAGYEVMEHLAEATLKEKTAAASLAVENGKLNDKLMEEKEAFIGLTQGPMAEAIQKSKDYKETISGLPELVDQFNKRLEAQSGFWDGIALKAEKAGVGIKNFFAMAGVVGEKTPYAAPMDNKEIETRVQELKAAYSQTKDLTAAMKELKSLEAEVRSRGGAGLEDRITPIKEFMAQLQTVTDTAAQHQKNTDAEVAKNRFELEVKTDKDIAEAKKKIREMTGGKWNEAEPAEGQKVDLYKDSGAGKTAPSIFPDDKQTDKQFTETMKDLQDLRTATDTQWDQMNQDIYKSLDDRLKYVQQNAMAIENAQKKQWTDIQKAESNAMSTIFSSFNTNMMAMMKGQETFKTAMLRTWVGIAEGAMQGLMKTGEAQLQALALGKELTLKTIFMNAKAAATGAWNAMSTIPIVGPELGAAAAASTFAAVMAFGVFKEGGVSEGGLAMLHPKEMVLPPKLSEFVQKSAAAATPGGEGGGGGDTHYNFQGMTVHTSNSGDFVKQLKQELRRGRLRP